jgi:hypothetical protein
VLGCSVRGMGVARSFLLKIGNTSCLRWRGSSRVEVFAHPKVSWSALAMALDESCKCGH